MNNLVLNQVQALHTLIEQNYRNDSWCVLPCKGEKAMMKLQIHLSDVFPSTKAGRENRLDTLVAILPLLNPGKKPIDLDSTNRLWIAEIYAMLTWLDANGKAKEVLRIVSLDPQGYAVQLRKLLGYIERPGGNYYVPETEPAYVGDGWWASQEGAHERERQESYLPPF